MQGRNIVKINKPCPTKDLYFKTFWNWTDSSSYYRSSSHQLFHELCLPSRQSGHQLSPIWSHSSNIDPINITTICFPLCSSSVSFRFWSPSTWICNCLGSDIFPLRWPRFQFQLSYFSYHFTISQKSNRSFVSSLLSTVWSKSRSWHRVFLENRISLKITTWRPLNLR